MAKVLLVEDDNNLREIYQARLAAEGYDIVAAQNGEEALVVAKQNKPDLIISDVMMPRISGFEMLDILRNTDELKNTKVIMLTALGQAEDQTRADNLGADKYLVKSQVTLEDIVNAAKSLLGETDTAAPAATVPPVSDVASNTDTPTPTSTDDSQQVTDPLPDSPNQPVPTSPAEPAVEPLTTPVSAPIDTPESVVPASVVPQPDTEVVVPPAPANPTPPSVTVAPITADPTPADTDETVVPAPEPVSPALDDSTGPSSPALSPDAAVQASQALETEEAAVQEKIDTFASQNEPTPSAVEPTPATTTNDQAIAEAVEQLNSPVESAPTTDPTPVTTSVPVETAAGDAVEQPTPEPTVPAVTSVGGTKVIQPLRDVTAPGSNLDQLLAEEEAKEAGDKPSSDVQPSAPDTTVDPNSIAL